MIKQVYKKNGFVIINKKDPIKMNYFIINNYDKNKKIDDIKKEYYRKLGFSYLD